MFCTLKDTQKEIRLFLVDGGRELVALAHGYIKSKSNKGGLANIMN